MANNLSSQIIQIEKNPHDWLDSSSYNYVDIPGDQTLSLIGEMP